MSLLSVVKNTQNKPLDVSGWKKFKITDIFDIGTGACVKKQNLIDGELPRISVTNLNNGIQGKYSLAKPDTNLRTNENFISFSFLGTCFYHPYKASLDMKVHTLKPKNYNLTKNSGLFLVALLKSQFKNLSYGDQVSSSDLKNMNIMLPVDSEGNPDWAYMENYIDGLKNNIQNAVKALLSVINTSVGGGAS